MAGVHGGAGARCAVQDIYIPGPTAELHIRIYTPQGGVGPFPCIVFFHGGGWTAGNIHLADRPHRSVANATGCVLVAVNYQKAPEHRFPTALDDCYASVEWVVDHATELAIEPAKIGVGGDSAGGNLAAAVCLKARDTRRIDLAFQLLTIPRSSPIWTFRPPARTRRDTY